MSERSVGYFKTRAVRSRKDQVSTSVGLDLKKIVHGDWMVCKIGMFCR